MDGNQIKAILERLKANSAEYQEHFELITHMKSKISPKNKKIKAIFVKPELEYLDHLLNKSINTQSRELAWRKHQDELKEIQSILNGKGSQRSKFKSILQILELNPKETKTDQFLLIRRRYEELYSTKPDSESKTESSIICYYKGNEYKISWKSDREKKKAILAALMTIHKIKSMKSLIAKLRKLGTKNLPSQDGSGRNHPAHKL